MSFTVGSSLQAEDLLYAVLTRQQVVKCMQEEAQRKDQLELMHQFKHEFIRLSILIDQLEAHVGDTDYREDRLCAIFPDPSDN